MTPTNDLAVAPLVFAVQAPSQRLLVCSHVHSSHALQRAASWLVSRSAVSLRLTELDTGEWHS